MRNGCQAGPWPHRHTSAWRLACAANLPCCHGSCGRKLASPSPSPATSSPGTGQPRSLGSEASPRARLARTRSCKSVW